MRAVAAGATRVTLLVGPRGRAAAELLPGVDAIVEHRAEWIDPEPDPVDRGPDPGVRRRRRAAWRIDRAIVLASFHQSPLPLALLLRLAGRAVDRRDLAWTTPGRCSTCATASTTTCTRWSGR